ncbi:MAG: 4Fe-4S binding protein [Rhodospirillaceae bacterium]|jgi:ferredoxin|nr:4Fe-4S binding protein [Rhodospirillaceae bacterium]MBT5242714.1 4Fe-4S binding protein [Rhodospirillaceae bacterium]MBT5561527.1 4Fe-4S binding protein [Rhodospirillaceae bacterium]MBT6241875.1 4Fe-4S binding protein [Rhodospirillaceae bacterium]MBT7138676.1 4Fe-4S binding protein [Rhodospirillaceae bacterium]
MTGENNKILICDCDASMSLDAKALSKALDDAPVSSHTSLCRAQIENLSRELAGDTPVTVACTQEVPVFLEAIDEQEKPPAVTFVNIRERAGWSGEGKKAGPKIAALIAEAAVPVKPAINLTLESNGSVLILGRDEMALGAAIRLSQRLDVTLVFQNTTKESVMPPALMDFPVFSGAVETASGHLGNFEIAFSALAPSLPSSKGNYTFGQPGSPNPLKTDLILDLSGSDPLFTGSEKRDGYFNPSTSDPVSIERALFDLADMVGEFEKPRYVDYDGAICAHGRNGIPGCTLCVDLCPTGAITSADERVAIDPYICAGCGSCAGSCPTGAIEYAMPGGVDTLARLRTLLATYLKAGGKNPVLMIHDRTFGDEMIATIARSGKGLPAGVLPFLLNEVTQAGIDTLLAGIAYGASQILVMTPPHKQDEQDGLNQQLATSNAILKGLGYGEDRLSLIDQADPESVEARLYALSPPASVGAATFMALGNKRQRLNQILESLHGQAPAPVDVIELEQGAPFGAVVINTEGCTLCLSCVNACPAKALRDNPDAPELKFQESNCIQCGLCKTTCPENVISLNPHIDFTTLNAQAIILKKEEPFECIRCSKPFGVSSTIEKMIEKMRGHSMFQDPKSLDRLRMCDDCRVIDMAEGEEHPWASKQRGTKTTEDYLKEREDLRQQAAEAMENDSPDDD